MNSRNTAVLILAALVTAMVATRLPMAASLLHAQDASWAIFFLAGFWLRDQWRWAFPVLMTTAVGIDLTAIQYLGVSNYCVTVAYWFLLPAYGALWLGGRWLHNNLLPDVRGITRLALAFLVSVSACFLISNGSFYWIGGRVANPTMSGWLQNIRIWYGSFMQVAGVYVGVVALAYIIAHQLPRMRSTVER